MSERDHAAEILALEASIYDDPMNRHNVDHLLAPEFREVLETGETVCRETVLERLAASPLIVDSYPVDDARVDVYGDVAISTGLATLHGRLPRTDGTDQQVVRASRFVHVWVRTDDGWHVVYAQSSRLEPAPNRAARPSRPDARS